MPRIAALEKLRAVVAYAVEKAPEGSAIRALADECYPQVTEELQRERRREAGVLAKMRGRNTE